VTPPLVGVVWPNNVSQFRFGWFRVALDFAKRFSKSYLENETGDDKTTSIGIDAGRWLLLFVFFFWALPGRFSSPTGGKAPGFRASRTRMPGCCAPNVKPMKKKKIGGRGTHMARPNGRFGHAGDLRRVSWLVHNRRSRRSRLSGYGTRKDAEMLQLGFSTMPSLYRAQFPIEWFVRPLVVGSHITSPCRTRFLCVPYVLDHCT